MFVKHSTPSSIWSSRPTARATRPPKRAKSPLRPTCRLRPPARRLVISRRLRSVTSVRRRRAPSGPVSRSRWASKACTWPSATRSARPFRDAQANSSAPGALPSDIFCWSIAKTSPFRVLELHHSQNHVFSAPLCVLLTRCVEGFIREGFEQPSELGWGTHERWRPENSHEHKGILRMNVILFAAVFSNETFEDCPIKLITPICETQFVCETCER